jgi:hypothetical protein
MTGCVGHATRMFSIRNLFRAFIKNPDELDHFKYVSVGGDDDDDDNNNNNNNNNNSKDKFRPETGYEGQERE